MEKRKGGPGHNLEEAERCYLESAMFGNAEAQYKAGKVLLRTKYIVCFNKATSPEEGSPESKAIFWLQKAACTGHVKAHRELGTYYNFKALLKADRERAKFFQEQSTSSLTAAAARGDIKAMACLATEEAKQRLTSAAIFDNNVDAICFLLGKVDEVKDKIGMLLATRDFLVGREQGRYARISSNDGKETHSFRNGRNCRYF